MQGLLGRKLGMTQVYDANGQRVDVTVLEVGPCVVVQRKTKDRDGYDAVQLGFVEQKEHRVAKPQVGHFKKAGVTARRFLREYPVAAEDALKAGDTVTNKVFEGVAFVDIAGVTKGRGFQGVVKRHQMAGGPATHGHMSHRRIGAIGQRAKPGNIAKGHRMPGQMGNVNITTQNLKVVQIRPEENVVLVRGSVPGPVGALVSVTKAIKKTGKKA